MIWWILGLFQPFGNFSIEFDLNNPEELEVFEYLTGEKEAE